MAQPKRLFRPLLRRERTRAPEARRQQDGVHVTSVDLRDGESPEHLLTRFRQMVQRDGILREIKQRRHFIPKSERRRIARAKAARRRRRAKKTAA
jgi:ribosomal protein S21